MAFLPLVYLRRLGKGGDVVEKVHAEGDLTDSDTEPAARARSAGGERFADGAAENIRRADGVRRAGGARSTARPQPADAGRRVGWVALLLVWVLWGCTYFAIRVGVETIPPLLLAGTRYVIAGLLMFPFAVRARTPEAPTERSGRPGAPTDRPGALAERSGRPGAPAERPGWRAAGRPRWRGAGRSGWRGVGRLWARYWWSVALVGALLPAGGNGGVSVGERTVPSGLAALLVATVPLWLIVIDRVVNGARIGLLAVAGLVAGVVGVGFLSGLFGGDGSGGHGAGGASGIGVIIILAASVSWASGTIASRRLPLPANPLLATSMQMLTGGVVLFVAAAIAGEFSGFDPARVSVASLLGLLYLIGPGSIIAFSAYVVAVRRLPTPTVATYAYVNPIVAVILGASLLGEAVTGPMLLGGALVVVAVVLVLRSQARRARPAER
jgi:drug/metabolite transporter (DMT)-like permease